jgi:hypothetical protein
MHPIPARTPAAGSSVKSQSKAASVGGTVQPPVDRGQNGEMESVADRRPIETSWKGLHG